MEAIAPAIGQKLSFDQSQYNLTIQAQERLLPAIERVQEAYELLGLKVPFNQKLIDEILNRGTEKIKERLDEMTKEDTEGKNPYKTKEAYKLAGQYFEAFDLSATELKEAIRQERRLTSYRFDAKDFDVSRGKVVAAKDEIEKFFTLNISTDNQLKVYQKLEYLAKIYNETIKEIQSTGARIPFMGLIGANSFLKPKRSESGYSSSIEVEINPDSIKLIN